MLGKFSQPQYNPLPHSHLAGSISWQLDVEQLAKLAKTKFRAANDFRPVSSSYVIPRPVLPSVSFRTALVHFIEQSGVKTTKTMAWNFEEEKKSSN
jgi:hypothetical protein